MLMLSLYIHLHQISEVGRIGNFEITLKNQQLQHTLSFSPRWLFFYNHALYCHPQFA